MSREPIHPSDVVREFANDLESAYGTGDGNALDRNKLSQDWPDLLATYDHAIACLKTFGRTAENVACWRCPNCWQLLSISDWTYADLADRGIPICGSCDQDMELIPSPDDGGIPASSFSAWIIVDADTRSVLPRIYDEYDECASDTDRMDNALIVGFALSERLMNGVDTREKSDG